MSCMSNEALKIISHGDPEKSISPKADSRSFLASICILTTLFVLGVTYHIREDYIRTTENAQQQLGNLCELFERSIESELFAANLQMWNMINHYAPDPAASSDDVDGRYGDLMRETQEKIDQIDSLLLIMTNGTVVWSSVPQMSALQLGDQGYFKTALTLGKNEYTVGVPIPSSVTGRRMTPIAWPVVSPSNEVVGVIASSLSEPYFSNVITLSDIPRDVSVEIFASNGENIFRSEKMVSKLGVKELFASRKIPMAGLTVNVTRSHKAVISAFYKRTLFFLILATALLITSISMAIKLHVKSGQLSQSLKQARVSNRMIIAAQREFNAIFESVGEGIVIFSKDGKINRTNKIAREILGQQDTHLAIDQLRAMLPDFSKIPKNLHVHRFAIHDGQTITCRMMKLTSTSQEVAYCVLANATEEERLAMARATFVTSINHELRTPLTSLSGSLDLLRDRFSDGMSKPAKRLILLAARNSDRLLMLVNDILTLQALDQGQFNLRAMPLLVSKALEDAVASNSGYGLNSGVSLTCERTEPVMIFADPNRLQQIFSNLISNAIKYSPCNSTVKIGAVQTNGDLTFYVRDMGPGIPSSARARLFDRFGLPIHGSDVQVNGTGLGLAITKQLVELQDGDITFQTYTASDEVVETGTVFFVTFKIHTVQLASPEVET